MASPARKILLRVPPTADGQRLDQFLAENIPNILGVELSKSKIRKLIAIGAVYLNRKRVMIASKKMIPGAQVEAHVDLKKLQSDNASHQKVFELEHNNLLYEDEWLIAVNKPSGLPTQPTLDQARDHLFAAVQRFLEKRDKKIKPYLGLHHRLDFETSGVVIFTKKKEANKGVANAFANRLAHKTYHAVTEKSQMVRSEWEIENHLAKSKSNSFKVMHMTEVKSGGDYAKTSFKVLKSEKEWMLIEAKPHTGRMHQIRIHLKLSGIPILGDKLYGGKIGLSPRIMLHAYSLEIPHPILERTLKISAPHPPDFEKYLNV